MIHYRIDNDNKIHLSSSDGYGDYFIMSPEIFQHNMQHDTIIYAYRPSVREEVKVILSIITDELKERGLIPM